MTVDTVELGQLVADMLDLRQDGDALIESVARRLNGMVTCPLEAAEVVLGVCKVTAVIIERQVARAGVVREPGSDQLFACLVSPAEGVPLAGQTSARITVALLNNDLGTASALVIAAVEAGEDEAWELIFSALAQLRQQAR